MTSYEIFLQLHQQDQPLLVANVWDISSARVVEQAGFPAMATSSSAVAASLGYDDGERIPFELMLQTVERIIRQINIPLSVDLERGYAADLAGILRHIEQLHDLGVAGINLEDSDGNQNRQMQPMADFQKKLAGIAAFCQRKNLRIFINARTDAYLLKLPGALAETLRRARAYEEAGASGLFVPFLDDPAGIRQISSSSRLPLHVIGTPRLPAFASLGQLGVKRISMGGALYRAMNRSLMAMLRQIQEDQSLQSLF